MKPILIVCDEAPRIEAVVKPRFPHLDFVHATRGDEVIPALEAHRPEVAFSLKHSEFPAQFHRPLVEFPSLRWIHVGGSGYEHFVPWETSRLTLSNSVGVLAPFLAETSIGAMLTLNGGLLQYVRQQQQKQWRPNPFKTIQGQTLLVVGLGAIGGEVARMCRSLGMRVLGVRQSAKPSEEVHELHRLDALPTLLSRADVVSVNIRATEQTRHLFDAGMFSRMREGALFMNTSRGLVVDEPALIAALQSGHLGGAYLDVFETEPLPPQSPLWDMSNVLVTPHTADQTDDYQERFAVLFADNLEKWLAGEPLRNVLES